MKRMPEQLDSAFRQRVYDLVRLIPYGRVATYGDVALWCGAPRQARQVGWALHSLPDELVWGADGDVRHASSRRLQRQAAAGRGATPERVPWHRVINAKGQVSTHPDDYSTRRQVELLRAEGIEVDDERTLVRGIKAHRWQPEPTVLERLELPAEVLFAIDRQQDE